MEMGDTTKRHCKECSDLLAVGTNWAPSRAHSKSYICSPCSRNRYLGNRDRRVEFARHYHAANREKHNAKSRAYYARHRERLIEEAKRRRETNQKTPEQLAANAARQANRRALKRRQTPPNADRAAIQRLYEIAGWFTRSTGIPHHVDHIIPLAKGGAHHERNLLVMPAPLNLSKSDAIIPELAFFGGMRFEPEGADD